MSSGNVFPMADAVRAAYRAGEEDEALEPRILVNADGAPLGRIADGDYCIFYDVRGEREIELTQAFTESGFARFPIAPIRTHWATMIQYSPKLDVRVAFPPAGTVGETLSETIARAGRRQIKICESEKAVHVARPEMAARDVADAAVRSLRAGEHDFLFVNFANVDVVGHIENRQAILKAVATVDAEAGRVVDAAREAGVTALVTADHGTVEKWYYPEGTVDTGHTDSPVPFLVVEGSLEGRTDGVLRAGGALTDVAPTVLELLGLKKPAAMTGRSLLAAALPQARRRVLVILLDGWGVGDGGKGDLIRTAPTPRMDEFLARYPSTVLAASGTAVGMPEGTVGNSECGHLHLGSGRVIPTDRVRIEQAIRDGSFRANEAFRWAMEGAKRDATRLHLAGIISFYSSHGSVEHLLELVRMAHDVGVREVFIHGMLGRRGERPESGAVYTEMVEKECARLGTGRLVTILGRFWALDREENWDRIEKTYRALVAGKGLAVPADAER